MHVHTLYEDRPMSGVTKNLIEQWLFNTLFISYVHSLLELVVTTFEFIAFPPI